VGGSEKPKKKILRRHLAWEISYRGGLAKERKELATRKSTFRELTGRKGRKRPRFLDYLS